MRDSRAREQGQGLEASCCDKDTGLLMTPAPSRKGDSHDIKGKCHEGNARNGLQYAPGRSGLDSNGPAG